jgi:DNA-directed RNA polymerase specialized sigma24 family protein
MMSKVERLLRDRSRSSPYRPPDDSRPEPWPHLLNRDGFSDHIDGLYRAAWELCGSQHDAEDLVQDTFTSVLKRPRLLRDDNEIDYLPRALKNTYSTRYRTASRRPVTRQLLDDDALHTDGAETLTTKVATMRAAEVERAQLSRQYRARAQRAETVRIAAPTAHPASASAIGDARTW